MDVTSVAQLSREAQRTITQLCVRGALRSMRRSEEHAILGEEKDERQTDIGGERPANGRS